MCISDYRIGRLIRSQLDSYTITAAGTQTIPQHRDRVGIIIASLTTFTVAGQTLTIAVGGVCVATLFAATNQAIFMLPETGDLCTREFVLTANTSTRVIGVTQLFLPESALAAELDEFNRRYL